MDDIKRPERTKSFEPLPERKVEEVKKPIISSFAVGVHPDGTYSADVSGNVDLVLVVSALNELQNIVAKIPVTLLQQAQEQRRNALQHVPLIGMPN